MLTRVRLEAVGETQQITTDKLLNTFAALRLQEGGEWEYSESDFEIVPSDRGTGDG